MVTFNHVTLKFQIYFDIIHKVDDETMELDLIVDAESAILQFPTENQERTRHLVTHKI